jgi:hypothetical protein
MFAASAHADTCDGNALLSIGDGCTTVAGVTVTSTGSSACVSGAACATPGDANPNEPDTITRTVSPPKPPASKPPAKHNVAPKKAPVRTATLPIRIREADTDSAWFTSGSYEPTLPYHLPRYLQPFQDRSEPPARSSARIVDFGSMNGPLRTGLIYTGAAMLLVAVMLRRTLVTR